MLTFRKLDAGDFEKIYALYADVFMRDPWFDDWSDSQQLHAYLHDLTGNQNSLSYGMMDSDELIGASLGYVMHWWEGTQYYIHEFFVKPEFQHCGVGSSLLNQLQIAIKQDGISSVFLQTSRNIPAYYFYKSNGFTEFPDRISLIKHL